MKAIEFVGDIDAQHRLQAQVPDEDEAGVQWSPGLTHEWAGDLGDTRQDIYSLTDGQPVDPAP